MLLILKKLFRFLTPIQRKRFYILQILVVLMALMEIIGVASIIPFMALVGDMSLLNQDTIMAKFYQASGLTSEIQFMFLLGIVVLIMLFLSSILSMFTTWKLAMFGCETGAEISSRLYNFYLKQNWLFHASGSSAQLTRKIATETGRVTNGILVPIMQMNAKFILAIFISFSIFIYDITVAVIGLFIFSFSYIFLFGIFRKRIQLNGMAISKMMEQRFRLMNEGFGGIKDVLLLGRDSDFVYLFNQTGGRLAYSQGTNSTLAQIPRYLMELVAFGSLIMLLIYLIFNHEGDLGVILPVLSVYTMATLKLLPAFQQIYTSLATAKGNVAALEAIQDDLAHSMQIDSKIQKSEKSLFKLSLKNDISLENITFTYPGKSVATIKQLNMFIPAKKVIGIVGPSGSGKSTVIDILLGLIEPQIGQLKVDGIVINNKNLRSWQNMIGFVAQSIFLSEGTIAENIAFGIPKDSIDLRQAEEALKLAHLDELVKKLELGINTKVGERGVQLSGGQRQRIGIARALYHNADILVLDEATSSLDGITEKNIMNAIHNLNGQKTIILIAHRLKTVQKCDQIFFVDQGQVIDQGTYQELIETNEYFKNMAANA
ncbi:ABC transporter ATP-binding protein/permease [Gammaproteobacteria bacterium]|nr:ABC transporter ATP-binding protein/permease [Gammaproteobacteria bacterium]